MEYKTQHGPITGQVERFCRLGGPCRLGRKFPTLRLTGNIVPSEKPWAIPSPNGIVWIFLRWTISTIGTWFTPPPANPSTRQIREIFRKSRHAFVRHTKLCVVCLEKPVQVVHIINKPATQPTRRFKRAIDGRDLVQDRHIGAGGGIWPGQIIDKPLQNMWTTYTVIDVRANRPQVTSGLLLLDKRRQAQNGTIYKETKSYTCRRLDRNNKEIIFQFSEQMDSNALCEWLDQLAVNEFVSFCVADGYSVSLSRTKVL